MARKIANSKKRENSDRSVYIYISFECYFSFIFMQNIVFKGHKIFDKNVQHFDLTRNFNLGLKITLIYFLCLFSVIVVYLIVFKILKKKGGIIKHLKRLPDYTHLKFERLPESLPSIFTLMICFNFFNLLVQLILTSNTKTNSIIIDTSDILKNEYDILKNKERIHCYLHGETELQISINSPKNTVLHKIYYEKSLFHKYQNEERKLLEDDRCIMKKTFSMVKLAQSKVFFILTKVTGKSFAIQ